MKASELIENIQHLIQKYGDCDIKIVGDFIDGLYDSFVIEHGSNYYEESFWNPEKSLI